MPFSQREIVLFDVPSRSPSYSCVNLRPRRSSDKNFPILTVSITITSQAYYNAFE